MGVASWKRSGEVQEPWGVIKWSGVSWQVDRFKAMGSKEGCLSRVVSFLRRSSIWSRWSCSEARSSVDRGEEPGPGNTT